MFCFVLEIMMCISEIGIIIAWLLIDRPPPDSEKRPNFWGEPWFYSSCHCIVLLEQQTARSYCSRRQDPSHKNRPTLPLIGWLGWFCSQCFTQTVIAHTRLSSGIKLVKWKKSLPLPYSLCSHIKISKSHLMSWWWFEFYHRVKKTDRIPNCTLSIFDI